MMDIMLLESTHLCAFPWSSAQDMSNSSSIDRNHQVSHHVPEPLLVHKSTLHEELHFVEEEHYPAMAKYNATRSAPSIDAMTHFILYCILCRIRAKIRPTIKRS